MIVPSNSNNKIGLDVFDKDNIKVTLDCNTNYFIFDDTCYHQI